MNNRRKEVFFDMYCKTCKYYKQASYLHPCNDCLNTPYNEDSHKPVNWKEGKRMVKNTKCKELFPRCLCNTCRRREMDRGCCIAHHRECQLVGNDQNANRCPGYTMKVEVKTK